MSKLKGKAGSQGRVENESSEMSVIEGITYDANLAHDANPDYIVM